MSSNKVSKGIPVVSKIPTSGRDSGTHSRSSSVSNLTTASDIHSEAGDAMSENAQDFKVNDRVWVNGSKPGYIKFLGKTQFAPGLWAGVVLDEAVGKNDGSVAGVKYFSCEPLRGIFARPQKLSKTSGPISGIGDTASNATTPRNSGFTTPTSRALAGSNLSLSSNKGICSRLRIGERVVVSSTTGVKSGILRFLGETEFAKGEWAGIELDEAVGKNDGSVAGKKYFSCAMKHGLFSPLHKVSRAGGTSTPRPPSVRGTPLMRSTSRDSLSSSVSSSSKASRVKLGITSLTNSQSKTRSTGGIGIMTTSRALEEALKEKDQHIEQLLKEHDLERAEVANVMSRSEEVEKKYSELLKLQQMIDTERKDIEQQLSLDKRKVEDLQFQLEEEKITRSDLETQLQQQTHIFQRLENFLNEKLDAKFVNIKEILEGKENLSESLERPETDAQSEILKERIATLEANLQNMLAEKNGTLKELEELKMLVIETEKKHEDLLLSLNTTVQEKDDVISNLKTELNLQLEKVTQTVQENNNLTEQISLLSSEAKGHTDVVIKEFGEKIKSLSEELNSKSNLLQEHERAIQEKDAKNSSLDKTLEAHAQQLAALQNQNQILIQDLQLKTTNLNLKTELQMSLGEEVVALKSKLESETNMKEEKILDLVKEIERITGCLQEKEDELSHKQEELLNLNGRNKELAQANAQMQSRMQATEESVSSLSKGNTEIVVALRNEIEALKEEKEHTASKFKEDLQILQSKIESASQELEIKKTTLAEKESEISSLSNVIKEKDSDFSKVQNEIAQVKQMCDALNGEKTNFIKSLTTKEESISALEAELGEFKNSLRGKNETLLEKQRETDALEGTLKEKEEETIRLASKLQLAEQNVEMLNKDSSEHVTTLQGELSKLKDESVKDKTTLEQKIADLLKESEKRSTEISDKSTALQHKEEELTVLRNEIKSKGDDVSKFSDQVQTLENKIATLTREKEEMEVLHEKHNLNSKTEFNSELQKRDLELVEAKKRGEELSNTITEKNSILKAKEEELLNVQNQLKAKRVGMDDLSSQIEKLKQELDSLRKEKEEGLASGEKELLRRKEESNLELKKKEKVIAEKEARISECTQHLEERKKELQQRDDENVQLRTRLQEKESQFDELSQMIEMSQSQLQKLSGQNESNVKLLQSKELFINDFKAEKEKQLLELEENLRKENSSLQEVLKQHERDVKQKGEIISKLNAEAEEQKTQLELLSGELVKSKAMSEKTLLKTNEAHKEFVDKIADLESKYSKLLEEKKKIEDEEHKAKGAKTNLEKVRDNLLQEKAQQEKMVKDKETRLETLQAEVNRMQAEFTLHKQELQQKLDVSQMELEAASELKSQLELQHSVLEELQQELSNSEDKCKSLELQVQNMSSLTSERTQFANKLAEYEKLVKEKSEKISNMGEKHQAVEELLKNSQNILVEKELECTSLNEKIRALNSEKESGEKSKSTLKSVEQENILLKHKIDKLEKSASERNANATGSDNSNQGDAEERESLISQIDFLNSIIVDMKQKNENLQQEVELLTLGPEETDANLNDVKKKPAPRLFCDICDMFDLHETDDCPTQASFVEDEAVPHLLPQGVRKLEERPYCNTCEIFGHWTLDCEEQDTY